MGSRFSAVKGIEGVTLIQPQHKGGAFKVPAKGQCLNCMDEQEYDLMVPVNRKEPLLHQDRQYPLTVCNQTTTGKRYDLVQ